MIPIEHDQMLTSTLTKNDWKSVLFGDLNQINQNRLQLKRLVSIKRDLTVPFTTLEYKMELGVVWTTYMYGRGGYLKWTFIATRQEGVEILSSASSLYV